jgi:hypothetical protein
MGRPKSIITKAELAAVLGLSKGRISQLSKRDGFPCRPDGRIDRERAVQWYHDAGLGNGVTKRGPRPKAASVEIPTRPSTDSSGAYHAVLDALLRIASPAAVLRFAAVALRAGCSAESAYCVAQWFACQPALDLTEINADDLSDFTEPTREQWIQLLGPDFDFDAADGMHDAATFIETSPPGPPAA